MNNTELVNVIAAAVKEALAENAAFSNVARPKATKASTATQGAWTTKAAPKASASTEGAWDATDTPGGVSSNAKKVWTIGDIEKDVRKIIEQNPEFRNAIHPRTDKQTASNTQVNNDKIYGVNDKISASTQPAWKKAEAPSKKVSASTIATLLTKMYHLDE